MTASYRVKVCLEATRAYCRFIPGMVDSLNAEIALGTITNVPEAIQWLGYTYLFGKFNLRKKLNDSSNAQGTIYIRNAPRRAKR